MSNLSVRLKAETQRSISAASIAGSPGTLLGIGTAYANPVRIYYLLNNTDADLQFSWDGINNSFVLPSKGFLLLDVTTNRTDSGGSCNIAQGDRTYVTTLGTPTTGSVYLTIFYGSNG